MNAPIRIIVNGEPREVSPGSTLEGLIRDMGLAKAACAAEVNKQLVRKPDRTGRALQSGDVVEVVTLVGGG